MIKKMIRQLWSSRRSNSWIFIELVVIFIAIWLVIDPVYNLVFQQYVFPKGNNPDNVYVLKLKFIPERSKNHDPLRIDEESLKADLQALIQHLKNFNGVEFVVPSYGSHLYSGGYSGTRIRGLIDTSKVIQIQYDKLFAESNYFSVYGITDRYTGRSGILDSIPYTGSGVFISASVEDALFGKGNGVGKTVQGVRGEKDYKVLGVINNVKGRSHLQPMYIMFIRDESYLALKNPYGDGDLWGFKMFIENNAACVLLRTKGDEAPQALINRFKKELLPKLRAGNIEIKEIRTLNSYIQAELNDFNVPVTIKVQCALAAFFLINICLAIFATFWLRIKKRKSEIGLRIAIGSTPAAIKRYFITESFLLLALSSIIAILALVQIIYFKGFYEMDQFNNTQIPPQDGIAFWLNNPFGHFAAVTIITFCIIAITVWIGTILPASRAARTAPADALRAE